MATIKFLLRGDKVGAGGLVPLFLRVTHERKSSFLQTGIRIKPEEWKPDKGGYVRRTNGSYKVFNDELDRLRAEALRVIFELKASGSLSAPAVTAEMKGKTGGDFFEYAGAFRDELKRNGHVRLYKQTGVLLNRIKEFTGSSRLEWSKLDSVWLRDFDNWLEREKGNARNTRIKHFERLQRITTQALEEHITDRNVFEGFQKPQRQRTGKEAITIADIGKLEGLQVTGEWLQWTRDVFLFSFYCGGVRVGDLIKLKRANVHGSRLVYSMSKTLSNPEPKTKKVLLNKSAQTILDRYDFAKKKREDYLFPFLSIGRYANQNLNDPLIFDRVKQAITTRLNGNLKELAALAGIEVSLSTHVARHSFALHALRSGMSVTGISKVLAHSDLSTTQTYLNGFSDEMLDEELTRLWNNEGQ